MRYYSPYTGELIATETPSDWMGKTEIEPPVFDRATQGAFFKDGAWVIVDAVPAVEPTPVYACNPWQIRKVLNQAGKRKAVEDAVAASGDIQIKDGWEFATEFRSDDPFVISMGGLIGMDAAATREFIQQASVL